MKNTIKVFVTSFIIASFIFCSDDKSKIEDTQILNRKICPDGYDLVITVDFSWHIFAKFDGLGCKKGFGFCFSAGPGIKIDCVKKVDKGLSLARVNYNLETESGTSLAFKDEENKTYTFYYHKNLFSSQHFQLNEFDYFNISKDFYLDEGKTIHLLEGDYPKQIEGDYVKYIIPYVD
jgi:hypothetical protein